MPGQAEIPHGTSTRKTALDLLAYRGLAQTPSTGLRLWRKVPENDARSVTSSQTPALVYDILPSTTAVFSYAIVSIKLSANEQFFAGA